MQGTELFFLIALPVLIDGFKSQPLSEIAEHPKAKVNLYRQREDSTLEKVEFKEDEKYLIARTIIVLECTAGYPVEWISHYSKGTERQNAFLRSEQYLASVETGRHTANFLDSSSYQYTAKFALQHNVGDHANQDLLIGTNFTCEGTNKDAPELEANIHIIMTIYKEIPLLQILPEFSLKITYKNESEYLDSHRFQSKRRNDCNGRSFAVPIALHTNNSCWKCSFSDEADRDLFLFLRKCQTKAECETLPGNTVMSSLCIQGRTSDIQECKMFTLEDEFIPDIEYCPGGAIDLRTTKSSTTKILSSYKGKRSTTEISRLSSRWIDEDPSGMLFMYPVKRKEVYLGEEVTITCELSRFYFSRGSWFSVKYPGGGVKHFKAFERRPCKTNELFPWINQDKFKEGEKIGCEWTTRNVPLSTFTATLRTRFETIGRHEISCHGPVWNSNEWVNASVSITVTDLSWRHPPEVTVRAAGDQSTGKMMLPQEKGIFSLDCRAEYPIEWKIHQSEQNDRSSPKIIRAETQREVEKFENSATYFYTASILIEHDGGATALRNFTCRFTLANVLKLQTYVMMTEKGSWRQIEIFKSDRGASHEQFPYHMYAEDCSEKFQCHERPPPQHFCWACSDPSSIPLNVSCRTPIECANLSTRKIKTTSCQKEVRRSRCEHTQHVSEFTPKLAQCLTTTGEVAASELFFFGLLKDIPEEDAEVGAKEIGKAPMAVPVYANWGEVDPSTMIYFHPMKRYVAPGETVEFKCEFSRFYFSLGSWFGVKKSEGNIEYFPAVDTRPCDTDAERQQALQNNEGSSSCNASEEANRRGAFIGTLRKRFEDTGTYQVFCFGPVWNSTRWVNSTRVFDVVIWQNPKVLSVTPDRSGAFIIGEMARSLKCKFRGSPPPSISWTGPREGRAKVDFESGISTFIIDDIDNSTAGTYTCYASSHNMSHFGNYTVFTETAPFPVVLTAGIVIGVVVVVIVKIYVFTETGKRVGKRRKKRRLFKADLLNKFLKGVEVPEEDTTGKVDILVEIHKRPISEEYEISRERLDIDILKVLGKGEYSIFYKGKLLPKGKASAAKSSTESKVDEEAVPLVSGTDEETEVAVRVSKEKLPIAAFKSLISEVKVMATLGSHENIVSLIGASTESITSRMIYIAIELCDNGCLETYVRDNKEGFFNKVKCGRYQYDMEPPKLSSSGTNGNGELPKSNPPKEFSTTHLIGWSRDIAAGVEYIHSKNIFHGEVALKNVLITKEFVAKVCDFGLSKRLEKVVCVNKSKKAEAEKFPWMAIECFQQPSEFCAKSDMWSLGVTLWELFTLGGVPYVGITFSVDFVREIRNGCLRLSNPSYAPNKIYKLMLKCWEIEPEDRPSADDIRAICDGLLQVSGHDAATPNDN